MYNIRKYMFSELLIEIEKFYNVRMNPFHNFNHAINGKIETNPPINLFF